MPLKGLKCPTTGEKFTWSEVKNCGGWGYYLPFALSMSAQALAREEYLSQFPDPKLSVSAFVKPLRQVILDERHEYYDTPDALIDMWAGTVLHAEVAKYGGDNAEVPLSTIVEGITLCGRPDHINPLGDLKDTKRFTVGMCLSDVKLNQVEYWLQLQFYHYLLQVNGYEPNDEMFLLLRAKDYSDTERVRAKSPYPESRLTRIPIEPDENIGDFIVTRVKRYLSLKDVPDAELPMCDDSARWPNSAMKSYLNNAANKATGRAFNRCRFYCPVANQCAAVLGITNDELSGIAEAEGQRPSVPEPEGFDYINAYNVCIGKFGKEAVEEIYHVRGYKGHPKTCRVWVKIHNLLKQETNHES